MFCWFFGHRIKNDICIKCGKSICEIKNHEWVYSHYEDIKLGDMIQNTAFVRGCKKCYQIEKVSEIRVFDENSSNILGKKWERIK